MLKPILAIATLGLGGSAVGLVAYLQYAPRAFTMPKLATASEAIQYASSRIELVPSTPRTVQAEPVRIVSAPKPAQRAVLPKRPAMQTVMQPCSDWRALSPKYVDNAQEQHHVRQLCATQVPVE